MSFGELTALESWAGILISKLAPAQRRTVNRKIALELRRRQSQRIASQRQPDGSGFLPRKPKKNLRGKAGRIKRKSQKMFSKIRTAHYMRVTATDNQLAVGFFGRIARIARVHQQGMRDKIDKRGPDYKYPARVLLGFSQGERDLIRDTLLRQLQ